VLAVAGLDELAGRRVDRLSGGQAQRVRFALALVGNPEVLVLDEPTAAMDVSSRRDFSAAMRQEAAGGRTVLFATHYLEEAEEGSDRVVVLACGRVVADGSPARIKAAVGGRTVRFTFRGPLPGGSLRVVSITRRGGALVPSAATALAEGTSFAWRCRATPAAGSTPCSARRRAGERDPGGRSGRLGCLHRRPSRRPGAGGRGGGAGRRHWGRRGQPGGQPARQALLRGAAGGRPGQQPQEHLAVHRGLGVDTAVSAPAILTRLLDTAVGIHDVVALLRSEHGGVALVEVTLDDDAAAVGRRTDQLELPEGSVVVAVVRGERVLPGGSDPLEPGDELLAVTALDTEPALRQAIGGHPGGSHIPGS
jgi:TrkA-C domain/ABC transporter